MYMLARHYDIDLATVPNNTFWDKHRTSRVYRVHKLAQEKGYRSTYDPAKGEGPLDAVYPPGRILCFEGGGYSREDAQAFREKQ